MGHTCFFLCTAKILELDVWMQIRVKNTVHGWARFWHAPQGLSICQEVRAQPLKPLHVLPALYVNSHCTTCTFSLFSLLGCWDGLMKNSDNYMHSKLAFSEKGLSHFVLYHERYSGFQSLWRTTQKRSSTWCSTTSRCCFSSGLTIRQWWLQSAESQNRWVFSDVIFHHALIQ